MAENTDKPVRRESKAPIKSKAKEKDAKPGGLLHYWNISIQFLQEVKTELRKVVWPSRKQALTSTGVVLVLVAVASIFLGLIDYGLSSVVGLLIGRG